MKEIPSIIHELVSTPPYIQQKAILKYFLPDAWFRHIICRVPKIKTFELPYFGPVNSRYFIGCVYIWYKSLSPTIRVDVHSVGESHQFTSYKYRTQANRSEAFDQKHNLLYISMHQRFSLWILPFYSAYIPLTTILHLQKDEVVNRYYIEGQEDLYQPEEFFKFFLPGGYCFGKAAQLFAGAFSVLAAIFLVPFLRILQMILGYKMD